MTEGTLRKMPAELVDPVHYRLPVGEELIDLNPLLGQEISLVYSGRIFCIELQIHQIQNRNFFFQMQIQIWIL